MSEPSAFGFGQFVPGFDFLQNLSKTTSTTQSTAAAGMPGMASWVAPTLSVEDIDKRIQELKSVLFWLEQNTTALKATIQAMEVQKMTLTTLQSMNVNMADLAKAFTAKPPVAESAAVEPTSDRAAAKPKTSLFTPKPAPQAAEPEPPTQAESSSSAQASTKPSADAAEPPSEAGKAAVDPMQWWGALTQQFQGIAAAALKDVAGEAMKAGMAAKTARAPKTPATRKVAPGKTGKVATTTNRAESAARSKAAPAKTMRTTSKAAKPAPRKAVKK
jgi:hypothetical protein